jgi:hypothetical protein
MKILIILALTIFSTNLFATKVYYAKVVNIRGKASSKSTNGTTKKLKIGDPLNINDEIVTQKRSYVKIQIGNKGTLSVGPKSEIILKQDQKEKETTIVKFFTGQLRAKLKKNRSDNFKLVIKTKTAALGVRGTEFHVIHNKLTKITTAISYEGEVSFTKSSNLEEIDIDESLNGQEAVKIREGEFSGSFPREIYASNPTRMSPGQFQILKRNENIITGHKGKVIRGKVNQAANASSTVASKNEENKNFNKSLIPVPLELISDEYKDIGIENIERLEPKPGGYVDLNTGIYIAPPETATYDETDDLYYPPVEYGGFDEETGEYIPPIGLLLHPLKGFIMVSSGLQQGLTKVRKGVTATGGLLVKGVTKTGKKVYEGLAYLGNAFANNTGAPGKLLAKGVSATASAVTTGVKKTGEFAADTGAGFASKLADTMNATLYENIFKRISDVIRGNKYLSKIQLNSKIFIGYKSVHEYNNYGFIREKQEIPGMSSQLSFKTAYKKSFRKSWFVRPKFVVNKINTFRRSIIELREYDHYGYTFGTDIGFQSNFKGMALQSFLFVRSNRDKRYTLPVKKYLSYKKDLELGASKMLIINRSLSSQFDYSYTKYESAYIGNGKRHKIQFSEVLALNSKNYIRLIGSWAKIDRKKTDDSLTLSKLNLNYLELPK